MAEIKKELKIKVDFTNRDAYLKLLNESIEINNQLREKLKEIIDFEAKIKFIENI